MDQNKIGEFIAQCRKEHNMTQMQFAEKLGVTNKAVSKWETGQELLFACGILSGYYELVSAAVSNYQTDLRRNG